MDETPIFKITKLNIAENDRSEYIREAEKNMHDSIPAEEGTLLIGSGHDDAQGEDNYEVELFRNKGAEDLHIAESHVDDFAEVIDKIATSKKVIDLKPEVITTHAQKALNSYADNFVMRLVKVEVKKGNEEAFAHSVKKEITTSIASEPGMEIMMSGTTKKILMNGILLKFMQMIKHTTTTYKHHITKNTLKKLTVWLKEETLRLL